MKIGAVSWVKDGTYYENAKLLEPHVDYVELLVYTWDTGTRLLLEKELPLLRGLDLKYTVHLPTDTLGNCRAAYRFFTARRFPVRHYVLHPHRGWQRFITGKRDVLLENLIDRRPLHGRMALDIGHLVLAGDFAVDELDRKRVDIRCMHIHGVRGRKDHQQLNLRTIRILKDLARRSRACAAALENAWLTFEVFDCRKLLSSIRSFKHAF